LLGIGTGFALVGHLHWFSFPMSNVGPVLLPKEGQVAQKGARPSRDEMNE